MLKPKRKSSVDLERPPIKRNHSELDLDSCQVLIDMQVDDQARVVNKYNLKYCYAELSWC